jgi:hypothetical protein
MPVTINGSGSIAGLSVGGLGSGVVNQATLADGAAAGTKLGTGSVIQVLSDVVTDEKSFAVGANNYYSLSNQGLSVTITPSSASNKILIYGQVCLCREGSNSTPVMHIYILKDNNKLTGAVGDADSNRTQVTSGVSASSSTQVSGAPFHFLDTAGNTNARTYSIGCSHDSGSSKVMFLNRGEEDQDNSYRYRAISVITAMEIKG